MMPLAASEVAGRLGFSGSMPHWAEGLADVDLAGGAPALPALPAPDEAAAVLARLGVAPQDAEEVVATLPSPERTPELWWLLERCHRQLARAVGVPEAPRGWWPQLPAALGAAGGCFYAHLYLSMVPVTLAYHRSRGVPEDISWATLADLARHMEINRRLRGTVGVDEPWWMTLHLRGEVYECGRLQYHVHQLGPAGEVYWYPEDEAAERGVGWRIGDPALGIHIPESGPLTPELCEASLATAREFAKACFPERDRRIATCASWLLDDQLAEYLPADSNIIRFQRRFEVVPGGWEHSEGVLSFVFHRNEPDLDALPQETTLQRAVVAHLRNGGQWRGRTGWFEL
jgi:GNAT-like C-terminal domain/N-acyltransferase N-terminal domain